MNKLLPLAVVLATLFAIVESGCAFETLEEHPCPKGGTTLTYQNFGAAFFLKYCDSCHSAELEYRNGAPENYVFSDYQSVVALKDRIFVRAAGENASMPPGPDDLALRRAREARRLARLRRARKIALRLKATRRRARRRAGASRPGPGPGSASSAACRRRRSSSRRRTCRGAAPRARARCAPRRERTRDAGMRMRAYGDHAHELERIDRRQRPSGVPATRTSALIGTLSGLRRRGCASVTQHRAAVVDRSRPCR